MADFTIDATAHVPDELVPLVTIQFVPAEHAERPAPTEVIQGPSDPVEVVLAFLESVDPHELQSECLMRGEAAISAHQVVLEVLADFAKASR